MKKEKPKLNKDSILLNIGVALAAVRYWFNNKVPKSLLIITIFACAFLASQSVILMYEVKEFLIPSAVALWNLSPEWPMIVVTWSIALCFVAACMQIKVIALEATLQLYRRFGIKYSA